MNFVEVSISSDGRWAETEGLRLPAPERIRSRGGQRLTLGVRPEALQHRQWRRATHRASPPRSTCSSRSATRSCSTSAPAACRWWRASIPGVRVKAHENIRFALDPERLHFFDAKTEAAI